jgi:hypothetical protein
MPNSDMDKIEEAKRLCDLGFAQYTDRFYPRIEELLAQVEQTDKVANARRLCAAGPTLSSPRFAYPHIQSALGH